MNRLLYPAGMDLCQSGALLVLRVVMGVAFAFHGWPKIQSPLEWMGPEPPYPKLLVAAVAVIEFVGGILLAAGLLTRVAALGIAGVMLGAINFHIGQGDPFVGQGAAWELAAVFLACAIVFLTFGPGKFSADAALFGRRSEL